MTVDELIKELLELSQDGKGDYIIVDGESGQNISLDVWDKNKIIYV